MNIRYYWAETQKGPFFPPFLPGVKLQGLRELRVVVVLLLLVVMWCFYLPGHPTKSFAKQVL